MKRIVAALSAAVLLGLVACQSPTTTTKEVATNSVKVGDTVAGGFTVTEVDPNSTGYIATRDLGLAWYHTSQNDYANRLIQNTTSITGLTGVSQWTSAAHTTAATTWQGSSTAVGGRVVATTSAALDNAKADSYYGRAAALLVKAVYSSGSETTAPPVTTVLDLETSKSFFGLFRHEALISGTWTKDVTLSADTEWTLAGPVFIGKDNASNAVLTIEAGTIIKGTSSSIAPGMLVITRGSKIMAEGTSSAPIVFTSAKAPGSRAPGDWGGLVINGNAPVNDGDSNGVDKGEGETGNYGGNNPHDNSGVLKYVRSEFAGVRFTADNELNGIAFQGVGDGTTVDYIQAHRSNDDGVEFFGGTVNVTHLVSTGNLDDHFDWTSGFRGSAQFVVLQEYPLNGADTGMEGDNKENNSTATPFSHPYLANFTIIGSGYTSGGPTDGTAAPTFNAANYRRGTKVDLMNSIATNYNGVFRETDTSGSAFVSGSTAGAGSGVTYKGVLAEGVSNSTNTAGAYGTTTYNTLYTTGSSFVSGSNGNFYGAITVASGLITTAPNNANLPTGYIAAFTAKNSTLQNGTVPLYDTWTYAFKPTAAATNGTAQTLPTGTAYNTDYAANVFSFTATTYIGAIDPAGTDWTTGWTTNAAN